MREILDENEISNDELLEEKTIVRVKFLTSLWMITGFLGIVTSLFFLRLTIIDQYSSFKSSNEQFYFLIRLAFFSLLSMYLFYSGLKSRMLLNNTNHVKQLSNIGQYGIYIWSAITLFSLFIFYQFNFQ